MLAAATLTPGGMKYSEQVQAELARKEVASVVVGKLPKRGDEITINGLVFLVKFVDYKRGTVQLRIKRYQEDTEDENRITHQAGEIAHG
jgi:Mg2+/Co2+ transporter CorC